MGDGDVVTFPAEIVKVQTLADHGIRLTLDLPETATIEMAQLAEYKRLGVTGEVVFRPIVDERKWAAKQS